MPPQYAGINLSLKLNARQVLPSHLPRPLLCWILSIAKSTLHRGRYCSRATHLITMPKGCCTTNIGGECLTCERCQAERPGMSSDMFCYVSPLQLLNDGFDCNHATCEDEKQKQKTRYTGQNQVQRCRRISSLWKPRESHKLVDPHGALQTSDSIDDYDSPACAACRCSSGKRLEPLLDGRKRPEPFCDSGKRCKSCFSQTNTPDDLEKMQEPESVYSRNEILALLEDDFIAFACRKEINPLQGNLIVRALLNVLRNLS